MVCVGSTGIGRFARALLGSAVAELAEAAHCPVAIIRTQQSRPKPDSALIVVAVNDSPGNDDVVVQAIREAQLRHAPVLALAVWRDDLGEIPSDELDRRVHFWERRYPSVQFHARATRTGITDFLDVSDKSDTTRRDRQQRYRSSRESHWATSPSHPRTRQVLGADWTILVATSGIPRRAHKDRKQSRGRCIYLDAPGWRHGAGAAARTGGYRRGHHAP